MHRNSVSSTSQFLGIKQFSGAGAEMVCTDMGQNLENLPVDFKKRKRRRLRGKEIPV